MEGPLEKTGENPQLISESWFRREPIQHQNLFIIGLSCIYSGLHDNYEQVKGRTRPPLVLNTYQGYIRVHCK